MTPKYDRSGLLLATLMALGIGLRVFGAWCYEYSWSSDHGIASLMAKHMSEGADAPVFFYGQPYMGSFEPAFCSLLFRIFGVSEFAANLGSAFFGILLLAVVYLWGRDAGGRTAGLAALAYCVIGPEYFFQYQCWGNGGYAVMFVTNTLVLWMSARILARETRGEKAGFSSYIALGLVAGLGWWTTQMIAASLLTAALLYLAALRLRAFTWRALSVAPAFLLGGLPFWVWNMRNDWGTFRWFSRFSGRMDFWQGVSLFFGKRIPALIANPNWPHAWRVVTFLLYAAVAAAFLAVTVRAVRRGKLAGTGLHMVAAGLYMVIFVCVFSSSSHAEFNTPRYALPLLPAFAVMLGVLTASLWNSRLPLARALCAVPLLLIVVPHLTGLPDHVARRKEHLGGVKRAAELAHFLREKGIDSVYAPFTMHYLNFALREEFCFANLSSEVYGPYKVRMETAREIAVAGNNGDVEGLLKTAGGSASRARHGGRTLAYDFRPPLSGRREIPPSAWLEAVDRLTNNVLAAVGDNDISTAWGQCGGESWVEIRLREPTEVSGVRVVARGMNAYPDAWRVESARDGGWETLIGRSLVSRYYWAGPRPYWNWDYFRLEGRFAPVMTSRLRLTCEPNRKTGGFAIAEIQVFGESAPGPGEESGLDALLVAVKESGTGALYSDRWIANAVHEATGGRVRTCRRVVMKGPSAPLSTRVELTRRTAFLVKAEDAEQCRRVLNGAGLATRETRLAPWVLFDFPPDTADEALAGAPPLYWAGFSCFKDG